MTDGLRPLPDVERALGWIVAGFNLMYALTAGVGFVEFAQSTPSLGVALITALVAVPLVLVAALAVFKRVSRPAWGASIGCYATAILSWSMFVSAPLDASRPGWLTAMLIPAILQALMATRSMLLTALITGGLVGTLAAVQVLAGGLQLAVVAAAALMIAPFGLMLAAVVTVVRRTARRAGRALQTTLQEVAVARFDDVTETERVRTDALVHDTVLTTLLQAASAENGEETDRAARMAENALRVIAHVTRAGSLGGGVRLRSAVSAHEHRLDPSIRSFDIVLDDHQLEDLLLPADAANALLVAMTEAMDNSVRHADAKRRSVHLRPLGPDGVRIEVDDDGRGFDYPTVAGAGIRTRIINSMLSVEGRAQLTSALGNGTSVHLSWGSVSLTDVRSIESRLREVPA